MAPFHPANTPMTPLLKEIRHNPLLWLLVFVPLVFAFHKLKPESHTLLFVLSVATAAFATWTFRAYQRTI